MEEHRTFESPRGSKALCTAPHTLGHKAPGDFVLDQVTRSTEGFLASLDANSNPSAASELGGRERVGAGHTKDPLAAFPEELEDQQRFEKSWKKSSRTSSNSSTEMQKD